MCESHPVEPAPEEGHTRRSFLTRVALGASTVLVPGTLRGLLGAPAAAAAPPPPGTNYLNETAYRAAMHLHAAFSEVTGSLSGHISQAIANGVGIVVPTDHDWRIQLRHYGGQYHFSNWSEPTPSGYWSLLRRPGVGSLTTTSGATLVSGGAAPADQTAGAGALRLVACSTKSSIAKVAYEVDSQTSNADAKGTVLGRVLHIWVKADSTSNARTYLGVQLGLANDPGYGPKQITYRLRTDLAAPTQPTVTGGNAVIDVPVLQGQWFELVPELLADIAACWPSALPEDNSLNSMVLLAVGDKVTTVSGLFSYLHLETDPTYDPAAAYSSVLQHYRVANPGLLVPNGMEHSVDTHKCQLGGQQFFYAYPDTGDPSTHTSYGSAVAADLVAQIQAHDGVASYNHPFGIVTTSPPIGARHTAALTAQMTAVLASKCHGADCIEVGYNSRGMDLAGHLELFDCLSANGAFLTATGVSDDHVGKDWLAQNNRFVTLPWMVVAHRGGVQGSAARGPGVGGIARQLHRQPGPQHQPDRLHGSGVLQGAQCRRPGGPRRLRPPQRRHRVALRRPGGLRRRRFPKAVENCRFRRVQLRFRLGQRPGRRFRPALLPLHGAGLRRRGDRVHQPRVADSARLAGGGAGQPLRALAPR